MHMYCDHIYSAAVMHMARHRRWTRTEVVQCVNVQQSTVEAPYCTPLLLLLLQRVAGMSLLLHILQVQLLLLGLLCREQT